MLTDRQRLILAYACVSWDTALTHLAALSAVGEDVSGDLLATIRTEARAFAHRWGTEMRLSDDEAAGDAREYLTEHLGELNALLKEEG